MDLKGSFNKFPRVFWVVNALELLERGAYYGMIAVLSYHIKYNLKMPVTTTGILLDILIPFLYILPIISGALAEKYGYRIALVPAFAIIAVGYAVAGLTTDFMSMAAGFVILGIGTGMFKPITSGTIAHSTSEETRNFGYSIYYWMINVGSFVVPLLIAFLIPKESYQYVFFIASGLVIVNFVLAILFFVNPMPPNPTKSVTEVLQGAALVFKDRRFMILLLIYSGFWFMYSMNNITIVLFMVDFKVVGDWFSPAALNVVNPLAIIAVGLWLGTKMEKFDSLKCMVVGITIFTVGMFVMGITTNSTMFFMGIVIFSIGEFVTHPTYIAYVSKIAPKEKLPVYMGFGFLPTLIGYLTGNLGGAVLYSIFAEQAHRPKFFWAIICTVGLFTIALVLLYSQTLGKVRREEVAAKEAEKKSIKDGTELVTAADRAAAPKHPFWDSKIPIIAMLLIIPGVLGGAYAGGTDPYYYVSGTVDTGIGWSKYNLSNGAENLPGESTENTDTQEKLDIQDTNILNITFTLTWTDEPDMTRFGRTYTNQPDEFGLEVSGPEGKNGSAPPIANTHGQAGKVSVTLKYEPKKPQKANVTSSFNVTIICGNCGEFTPRVGVVGFTDTGNAWSLDVSYQYYARK